MKQYDLNEFIGHFLIPDLEKMISHQLHYYAFAIICQAVEVFGSVYDQLELDQAGASESRFNNGLKHFFKDDRYSKNHSLLFSVLRGPLIHQLRPGPDIIVCSQQKDNVKRENHLERDKSGSLILVIEQLHEDFKGAFCKLNRELNETNGLDKKKVTQPFIQIGPINPPNVTTQYDMAAGNVITIVSNGTGSAAPYIDPTLPPIKF